MGGVSLRSVSKQFGTVTAVKDILLDIATGEFTVFLGPSGCGKSTLLRMIAGLEELSAGEIWIDGKRIDALPPGERGVAMVFQNYALYPHMSVRQNLAFGLRNIGTPHAEMESKIAAAARMLEIEHLLDRRPSQLSGGQRQRVAIGRAIVKEPKVFLFDEPLSNLDAALRSRTRVEIARLHQRMRATMIFVTHDQIEAMTMATRIVVMSHGAIEQIGTPLEIYRRPRTRFVASFIGSPMMNFLPATVSGEKEGKAIVTLPGGARLDTGVPARTLPPAGTLTLGVRPEHVLPGRGLPATVDVLERLGERTLVYATAADGASIVYDEPGDANVAVGDRVALSIDSAFAHLFDADGLAYHPN